MQLSEAIRLGAMLRPQARQYFFDEGKSCAFGAALEATGTAYDADAWAGEELRPRWPWLFIVRAPCPVCGGIDSVRCVVPHLNNHHRWTREQIADWVESYERLASPDAAPAVREDVAEPIVRHAREEILI